ncbi:MAG: dihydrolipoamide dehydrogenase [Phycisphaerales bacterium]|jgi:dihydrolipoamide dehydrogenase|nr:dihydrolipoamide dehydrogenase [Phycisphaerales bacterium]
MPAEILMPQQSDTMTEGTVVRWLKKEGEKISAGDILAEIETDKATMEMEAFDSGTLAVIAVKDGEKVPVGAVLGVIATGKENAADVKKNFKPGGAAQKPLAASRPEPTAPAPAPERPAKTPESAPPKPQSAPSAKPQPAQPPASSATRYDFDIIVIGGGPAGYAAAIRAGQLKKKVLCVEKENLGGTCLNWGCIPTKALLEDGAFVRAMKTEAAERGIVFKDLQVDFSKIIGRSRGIAGKLQRGIGSLFSKYNVQHVLATGQLLALHKVKYTGKDGTKEVTGEHIILAVGARATQLPGMEFNGKTIITSREAMTLAQQPKRMAIIGAGAIGCEFADFYNAMGTEVTLIEMLPQLLPIEDDDVSLALKRSFEKRGIKVLLKTKTEKVEKAGNGVKLTLSGEGAGTIEADVLLVAAGVTANTDGLVDAKAGLELDRKRVKVTPDFKTNLENVWSVGDCISLHFEAQSSMAGYRHPDLAHVAHHEAVYCVERICGVSDHQIDYRYIPGCTYTHPQVASMGFTEKKAREQYGQVKIGKFPFSASGRAMAADATEGFVKLIFEPKYGELLGVHMVGDNVTELLAEMVMARKLEATESEIIEAMHPHPTMSEAIMEAAGVAVGRAIHL